MTRALARAGVAVVCLAAAGRASAQSTASPYRLFRYDEDFSFLSDPSLRTDPFDFLKYIELHDDPFVSLSFGGEARTRYEYTSDPAFGLRGPSHDDYLLQRFLLHADARVGDREEFHARAFVQLVSGLVTDEEYPKPGSQDDVFDLQQVFGEVVWGDNRAAARDVGASSVGLRVGRQEMGFGSYRLVTSREPTNARLTFDGVRATYLAGSVAVDAFVVRPVIQKVGVVNDEADDRTLFWGLYAAMPLRSDRSLGLDFSYFGLDRESTRYESGIGDETRHSLGVRIWGRAAGWDHDTEAVFQVGDFRTGGRSEDILAWTVASNTGYTFESVGWRPRVGLKLNVASGDDDPTDDRLGTFNPLFPRNNYFNDANLLAPYNFFDVHPTLQLRPSDSVTVNAGWDAYFRYSTDDAVFAPGGIVIPGSASDSRFVGSSASLVVEWAIDRHLSLTGSYTHFFAGDVVEDAGGGDVDFVGVWLTFKF